MIEKQRIVEGWPRCTLDEARRYATSEAKRTGKPRVVICNPDGENYFHDTLDNYEAGNACRPRCYVVDRIDP